MFSNRVLLAVAAIVSSINFLSLPSSWKRKSTGPEDAHWGCFSCCEDICDKNFLVFTASDMSKTGQNPDTSFSGLYTGANGGLQAWSVKPATSAQQDINLMFGLPSNVNVSCPLSVTLYFFVEDKKCTKGSVARMRIRADTKANDQELGGSFVTTISTGNFTIVEPTTSGTLENIIVTLPITISDIKPGNWVLLVLDRIKPLMGVTEYSENIYLTSVVVEYAIKN